MLFTRPPRPMLTEDERSENGYITCDCPPCYETHTGHDDDRDLGLAYYYCGGCGDEWYPDHRWPHQWPPLDVIIGLLMIAWFAALLLGVMLATSWFLRYHWHWTRDDASAAGLYIGIPV